MKRTNIKWRIEHIPNLIIRLCTFDHFYVCDECHRIHKRDKKEIDLGGDFKYGKLLANKWWYGSVCHECFNKVMNKAFTVIHDEIQRRMENGE